MGRKIGGRFRPKLSWKLRPAPLPNPIDLAVKRYARLNPDGVAARCGPSFEERVGTQRPQGSMSKKIIYPNEVSADLARDALSHVTGKPMYSYACARNEKAGRHHYHLARRKPPKIWEGDV